MPDVVWDAKIARVYDVRRLKGVAIKTWGELLTAFKSARPEWDGEVGLNELAEVCSH